MGAETGIVQIGDYDTPGTLGAKVLALKALLADPDTTNTSGAIAGGGLLDEMSPPALAQLRVELDALALAITGGADDIAYGQYTCVAADDTAGLVNIVTGLADTAITAIAVTIVRSGSIVQSDQVVTEPSAGTIRVADGSSYAVTAGDVITWFAIDLAA